MKQLVLGLQFCAVLVSRSIHQTVNFHTGIPFQSQGTDLPGRCCQWGLRTHLLRQHLSWCSLRHQDNYTDHSECLHGQNHNFIPLARFRLLKWQKFYQKMSFESMHITMCTECKTVTATLIHADHLNSVTSATDVHFHERYLTFLPPNPCSHTHLRS